MTIECVERGFVAAKRRRHGSEADHRQRLRSHCLEIGGGSSVRVEPFGQATVLVDESLDPVCPEAAQPEPDLERAEPACLLEPELGEGCRPLHPILATIAPEVRRDKAERVAEQRLVTDQHDARLDGDLEPLVRVDGHAVGESESRKRVPVPIGHDGRCPVGPIDVEPEILPPADRGDPLERIDAPGVRRAR